MACLLAEIGMTILGIVTLIRGRVTVIRDREVRGIPAYVVGVLLLGTYPTIFATAFTAGVIAALTGNVDKATQIGAACEFGSVVLILVASSVIAFVWGRRPGEMPPQPPANWDALSPGSGQPTPPMDPKNPYAPPAGNWPQNPYRVSAKRFFN